jgi:Ser-tRNA(Ala) deacylase AlaX
MPSESSGHMANLLYVEDAYVSTFEARVVRADGERVVLDRTAFYPRGGGQVGDTGELDGVRVVNTERVEGIVVHFLEKSAQFSVGQTVRGRIDWDRRYKIMRLHSASHIVQYVIEEMLGADCKPTSPGLVDDLKDRTDYSINEKMEPERLKRIEERVNGIIQMGYEIKRYSDQNDPDRRYWKIEPFRPMPCGGTHPRNTKEIGKIILRRGKKPGAGKERIEISLV